MGQEVVENGDGTKTRHYKFRALDVSLEVVPGIEFPVPAWTFEGQVPGPTIRAVEGDTIRITFINGSQHSHTIHPHLKNINPVMDGTPQNGPGVLKPGRASRERTPVSVALRRTRCSCGRTRHRRGMGRCAFGLSCRRCRLFGRRCGCDTTGRRRTRRHGTCGRYEGRNAVEPRRFRCRCGDNVCHGSFRRTVGNETLRDSLEPRFMFFGHVWGM